MFRLKNGEEIYEINTTGEIKNWLFEDMTTGEMFMVKTIEEREAFRVARTQHEKVKGFGSLCDAEANKKEIPYVQ